MSETACVTVNQLAILFCMATMVGFIISTLVLKYYFARRRARKMSPAQAEMMRLAEYINQNHPDYVQAGSVADIAIRLIDVLHNKKETL